MQQILTFTPDTATAIDAALTRMSPNRVYVIADSNTSRIAHMLMNRSRSLADARLITIAAGDDNKSLTALTHIWNELVDGGATRHSAVVNIGGGMVTDIGGFAAATFKRGIPSINVPTTLLGAVDAAVGGKTGINFHGLKNEIGAFSEAEEVIVSTEFFGTLPHSELLSGFAEMLKHALLHGEEALNRALAFDFSHIDFDKLLTLLEESVEVKRRIVTEDPHENGLRKSLNLGHTVAHAYESLAMNRKGTPIAHGHAVAWGLVTDLVLSHMQLGFDSATLRRVAAMVEHNYPMPQISCADYAPMIEFMRHDKKNTDADAINFTLLKAPGQVVTDRTASAEEIGIALDLTRDMLHI